MRRRAEKVFTSWLPGIFPKPLQWLLEVYGCTREYFEENVTQIIVLFFCISQKEGDSGSILKLPRNSTNLKLIFN
jgi:hypothetical protein